MEGTAGSPLSIAYLLKYLHVCAQVPNPAVQTPVSTLTSFVLPFPEGSDRSQRVLAQKHKA